MSFFDTEPIELQGIFDDESLEKLKKLCSVPDDIKDKMMDIMYYMVENKTPKISFLFESGTSFTVEISNTHQRD